MPDGISVPNVKNSYYNKARNFRLIIMAYRVLSKQEIVDIAKSYLVGNNLSDFPQNKEITIHYHSE